MTAESSLAALIAASSLPASMEVSALPGLTWHVWRPLLDARLVRIVDLTDLTDKAVLDVAGFGPRRLDALKAAVRAAGTETP